MAGHMERLLERSEQQGQALSFVVFVTDWRDAEGVDMLANSKFLSNDFVMAAGRHTLISGAQHTVPTEKCKRQFAAIYPTHVFFLQNTQARTKWPSTEDKVQKLQGAMHC